MRTVRAHLVTAGDDFSLALKKLVADFTGKAVKKAKVTPTKIDQRFGPNAEVHFDNGYYVAVGVDHGMLRIAPYRGTPDGGGTGMSKEKFTGKMVDLVKMLKETAVM